MYFCISYWVKTSIYSLECDFVLWTIAAVSNCGISEMLEPEIILFLQVILAAWSYISICCCPPTRRKRFFCVCVRLCACVCRTHTYFWTSFIELMVNFVFHCLAHHFLPIGTLDEHWKSIRSIWKFIVLTRIQNLFDPMSSHISSTNWSVWRHKLYQLRKHNIVFGFESFNHLYVTLPVVVIYMLIFI